jgi:flagellar biosynthesis/type III secretory pathway protein FliH
MAVIKRSQAGEMLKSAIVLDLGDLRRQGELLIASARRQAEGIVSAARAERERILSGAREEGRAEGISEGLAKGYSEGVERGREAALAERRGELAQLEGAWGEALGRLVQAREALVSSARRDVLALAAVIGEKVVKRRIEIDPSVVTAQLEAVLGMVMRPTRLVLRVHPEDRALVEQALPVVLSGRGESASWTEHVEVRADAALSRGSVVAELGGEEGIGGGVGGGSGRGGKISAEIDVQLDRIVRALLPGEERAARDAGGGAPEGAPEGGGGS